MDLYRSAITISGNAFTVAMTASPSGWLPLSEKPSLVVEHRVEGRLRRSPDGCKFVPAKQLQAPAARGGTRTDSLRWMT